MAAVLALPAACDLPRDPEGTLDQVRGGTLHVAEGLPASWAWRVRDLSWRPPGDAEELDGED